MLGSLIEFVRSSVTQQILRDPIWASVALVGQFAYCSRFMLQWIASEFRKRSHVPTAFWFLSLAGSTIMLTYSVHIKNPIFILGFAMNSLVYLRNLHLIFKWSERNTTAIEGAEGRSSGR